MLFFFFNDTATTEIYTLSLHDALPILSPQQIQCGGVTDAAGHRVTDHALQSSSSAHRSEGRSEEHTSELQSRQYLVCRLLLEKKKNNNKHDIFSIYLLQYYVIYSSFIS